MRWLQENLGSRFPAPEPDKLPLPSMLEVVLASLNIMQMRITRSRMANEPPELVVAPRLAHLRLLDFLHRAREATDAGRQAAEASPASVKARRCRAAFPASFRDCR